MGSNDDSDHNIAIVHTEPDQIQPSSKLSINGEDWKDEHSMQDIDQIKVANTSSRSRMVDFYKLSKEHDSNGDCTEEVNNNHHTSKIEPDPSDEKHSIILQPFLDFEINSKVGSLESNKARKNQELQSKFENSTSIEKQYDWSRNYQEEIVKSAEFKLKQKSGVPKTKPNMLEQARK